MKFNSLIVFIWMLPKMVSYYVCSICLLEIIHNWVSAAIGLLLTPQSIQYTRS